MVIKRGLWSACLCSPILGESKEGFLDLEPSTNRFCALLLKHYIFWWKLYARSHSICIDFCAPPLFFFRQLYLGMKRQTNEIECDKQIAQLYWILFSAGWSVKLGYMIPENGNMLVRESDWHGLGPHLQNKALCAGRGSAVGFAQNQSVRNEQLNTCHAPRAGMNVSYICVERCKRCPFHSIPQSR